MGGACNSAPVGRRSLIPDASKIITKRRVSDEEATHRLDKRQGASPYLGALTLFPFDVGVSPVSEVRG